MGKTKKRKRCTKKCVYCGASTASNVCGACCVKRKLVRKMLRLVKEGDFVG